jgi:hypothetical protein
LLRTGLVDYQGGSFKFLTVDLFNRLIGGLVVFEFYEAESFGTTSEFVTDQADRSNRTVGLEELAQLGFCGTIGKAPYK